MVLHFFPYWTWRSSHGSVSTVVCLDHLFIALRIQFVLWGGCSLFGFKNPNHNPYSDHLINVGKGIQISACYWWNSINIYMTLLFCRGNTLKKTKGARCSHLLWNSVALAFGSLEYLNVHWNAPKKEEI